MTSILRYSFNFITTLQPKLIFIMNKFYLILLLCLPITLSAQVKKYVLVEHFTNTNCPICTNVNPGIYAALENYPSNTHHVSIHPRFPYSNCALYQFDTEMNDARTNYYGNFGSTPTVFLDGNRVSSGQSSLEQAFETLLAWTSPIHILVEEGGSRSRSVDVTITNYGEIPEGDYTITVAVLERTVNYTGGNGEPEHYDVLRSIVTDPTGDAISLPAKGESMTLSYDAEIPTGVFNEEAYILAFVQETNTKTVLNSGTRFDDAVVTSAHDIELESSLKVFPNPAQDILELSVSSDFNIRAVQLLDASGKIVRSVKFDQRISNTQIPVSDLSSGHYLAKINLDGEEVVKPFVKN